MVLVFFFRIFYYAILAFGPKRLAHPRSPVPPLSTLTSRAAHAHPTSPRSTGFCAIWDCISSRSSGQPEELLHQERPGISPSTAHREKRGRNAELIEI